MSKRKLSKLLGKNLKYTAFIEEFSIDKHRYLLKDVRHEGKAYADHLWILPTTGTKTIDAGSKIMFEATAYMYNDKFDVRKQGLNHCKNFQTLSDDYHEQIIKEKDDAKYKRRRKQR